MAKVAIDLDSTLYDFETPFRQAYLDLAEEKGDKERYFRGAYTTWEEWRSPADVCGLEAFNEALAKVHSPEVIMSRPPFEDAMNVVSEIARSDHEIMYITNRDPSCQSPTEMWLAECGFPGSELICTMEDKQSFLSDCQYLIDDRPRTLINFVTDIDWKMENWGIKRKGFSIIHPYNKNLTDADDIYLAPTWSGLRFYLEGKGVINGRRRAAVQ